MGILVKWWNEEDLELRRFGSQKMVHNHNNGNYSELFKVLLKLSVAQHEKKPGTVWNFLVVLIVIPMGCLIAILVFGIECYAVKKYCGQKLK